MCFLIYCADNSLPQTVHVTLALVSPAPAFPICSCSSRTYCSMPIALATMGCPHLLGHSCTLGRHPPHTRCPMPHWWICTGGAMASKQTGHSGRGGGAPTLRFFLSLVKLSFSRGRFLFSASMLVLVLVLVLVSVLVLVLVRQVCRWVLMAAGGNRVEQTGQVCRPLVRQMSRWMFMSSGDRRAEQTGQAWRPGLVVGVEGAGEGRGEEVVVEEVEGAGEGRGEEVVEEVEGAGEGRGEEVVVEEAGWGALAGLGLCTVVM